MKKREKKAHHHQYKLLFIIVVLNKIEVLKIFFCFGCIYDITYVFAIDKKEFDF